MSNAIELEFLGADGTVTGSRTLVSFRGKKHLIDCGLFQGPKALRERNWEPFPISPSQIDSIVLTHAHLDHSGYLPRIVRQGYRGPIHASRGTVDLCAILLMDAAHLQEEDAEYANRTGYSNHSPAEPLYRKADAERAIAQLKAHDRDSWIRLDDDLSMRFLRSGHIIGSSFVQLSFALADGPRIVTFSGDIGHERSATLRGPVPVAESDVLVLESTYGDRTHARGDTLQELADIAARTFERGGVLVVPAFAVGRAQELVYLLRQLENSGRIAMVPIVLDSPMSVKATEVFLKHSEDHGLNTSFLDANDAFYPAQFETAVSSDESMMACMRDGPMVVISAAGMLNGGRILHHLKKRLPDARNTVLFVGYQAEGTKGRYLQDLGAGERSIRIHHKEVAVEAEIATLSGLSAHGDGTDMIAWLDRFQRRPAIVYLNHGAPAAQRALATRLRERYSGMTVVTVEHNARFDLSRETIGR